MVACTGVRGVRPLLLRMGGGQGWRGLIICSLKLEDERCSRVLCDMPG